MSAGLGMTIVPEYYSARHQAYSADLVVCRQVLEHISQPAAFLASIRAALGARSNTAVFFEVPNGSFVFQNDGIWDIIYEHCFYYTAGSLARLFSANGFDVLAVRETFEGQYLCIEARPAPAAGRFEDEGELESLAAEISAFGRRHAARVAAWHAMLREFADAGKRVALWGAGAKGAMFLNAFAGLKGLDCIVDINPHKWGLHVPGTGQEVNGPGFLKSYSPDVVLIMNGNYRDEIARQISELGLSPELISI
jgi:hypothetical protein